MKHAVLAAGILALGVLGAAPPAQAQAQYPAFTAKPVNLRAGPARDYPVVAVLPAGFQVLVQGCLADFSWCDIIAGYDRGWVYAGNILYNHDNNVEPIVTWGPMIGIAVLGFAFDDYWPRYYIDRPWYRDRHRWADVRPPRHLGPRPPLPAPAPPPPGWQPRLQPHPLPHPQGQPRPVPQPAVPMPQRPPQGIPQGLPPGVPHPGGRGPAPMPPQPQGGVPPRVAPVPHPVPAQPQGHRAPMPQQQQQRLEREHG